MRILLRGYLHLSTMRNGRFDWRKRNSPWFHRINQIWAGQIQLRLHEVGSCYRSFDKRPFFLSIHSTYGVSICSPWANSIYGRSATIRYISRFARNSICCRWQRVSIAPHLCYFSRVARWATHIERFSAISSRRLYRATRQRCISTSSRRLRHTTDSTCPVVGNMSTGYISPQS